MLIEYLLGTVPSDTFERDTDRAAVAKRQLLTTNQRQL